MQPRVSETFEVCTVTSVHDKARSHNTYTRCAHQTVVLSLWQAAGGQQLLSVWTPTASFDPYRIFPCSKRVTAVSLSCAVIHSATFDACWAVSPVHRNTAASRRDCSASPQACHHTPAMATRKPKQKPAATNGSKSEHNLYEVCAIQIDNGICNVQHCCCAACAQSLLPTPPCSCVIFISALVSADAWSGQDRNPGGLLPCYWHAAQPAQKLPPRLAAPQLATPCNMR